MEHVSHYTILRMYMSTTDKAGTKLLYEHIVQLAKAKGLTGATVFRGVMGFGMSSKKISNSKFWELTEKLPVVVELIDNKEVLDDFFNSIKPDLESVRKGVLVVMVPADVLFIKAGGDAV